MISKRQSFVMALLLLLSVSAQGVWAGNLRSDTLEVLFRVGKSDIDLSYADNGRRIDNFMQKVRSDFASVPSELIKLTIEAGASPEGLPVLNKRLGEERGIALRNILKQKFGREMNVEVFNRGPRWNELRKMIEESDEEWKGQALKILSQPAGDNDSEIDPRERDLRKLNNGRVWAQLQAKYLPRLRSTGTAAFAEIPEPVVRKDTIVILDTVIYLPDVCPVYEPPVYYSKNPAFKTNALFWGLGAPNLQFELPLGKKNRWSLEAEVIWSWITWNHNTHAEQIFNGGLEIRYWLGNRLKHHTLDGWHIGLAGAGGYYDFEWKKSDGYQGEYSNAYFNLGWQKRFGKNRRWGFDASLGLGWFHTRYRHYKGSSVFPVGHEEERDNHLMWQDDLNRHERYSQRRNFFGATHANIGFSYFVGKQKYRSRFVTPAAIEEEAEQARILKAAKAAEKQQNKSIKGEMLQAELEQKERAKAEKAAVKQAEERAKAEAKAAKEAEKEAAKAAKDNGDNAEKEAKAAAKEAEKAAAAEAKAQAKAAKDAEKAAEEQAKAEAKAAKAAAKDTGDNAEKEAKAAAKEAEKAAAAEAKAQAAAAKDAEKAAAAAAKDAEKAAAAEAKAQAAAAKDAEKAAAAEAKAQAAAAKDAEKEAAAQVKAAAAAAKDAEKAAAAEAKAQAAAAKEAEKAAAAAAKAAEKEAADKAKAEAAAAKEAEKAAAKAAKEAAKAEKSNAK